MGVLKTKGIIISENKLNDFDKMLTILTPGEGKISCVAKGARKPKSLLLGGTQFLCFSDFVLYKSGDVYSVNSCEIIEPFYNLRVDLDKLKYAVYITKIIEEVTAENQNSYRVLQLFLNTLYVISEKEIDLDFVSAIFKIKLMSLIGYMPNVIECSCCREKENLSAFSFENNGTICKTCEKLDTSAIKISKNTLIALQYIVKGEPKKIYSFSIPENDIKELKIIAKIYLENKLEKKFNVEDIFNK